MRVVLAEDDVLFREVMATLLERGGMAVVGWTGPMPPPQVLA